MVNAQAYISPDCDIGKVSSAVPLNGYITITIKITTHLDQGNPPTPTRSTVEGHEHNVSKTRTLTRTWANHQDVLIKAGLGCFPREIDGHGRRSWEAQEETMQPPPESDPAQHI